MAEAEKAEKTAASRVADVVVMLISLLILCGGFLAWKVYQANPQRNAYDLAVGIFNETYKEVEDVRGKAEPLLDNCAERTGNAEACDTLQAVYDSSNLDEPKKLSRITSRSTYEAETARVTEQTELARAAKDDLNANVDTVRAALDAALEQKVGGVRAQMLESAKNATSEISACQDVVDNSAGKVSDDMRSQAQAAIDSLQGLVDKAEAMDSENPEDYTALNAELRTGIEQVTYWINQVNIAYWG
ncbi:MAG: hypothetical protein IKS49_06810 [Actinomycetaceae bacterium]|nr:hypothetical protein [Actinomycetaceae bacterium]